MEVKIQGFVDPPRLDPELEHEPNSTLTPKLLIYYIGESKPNPLGVSLSLNERYELGFQGCYREGVGLLYIGRGINSGPSDQTDLKERRRCNLGGGGEPTFEGGPNRWAQGAGRTAGGADRPHMVATCPPLRWFAFWSLLESSHIGFAMDKRDLL